MRGAAESEQTRRAALVGRSVSWVGPVPEASGFRGLRACERSRESRACGQRKSGGPHRSTWMARSEAATMRQAPSDVTARSCTRYGRFQRASSAPAAGAAQADCWPGTREAGLAGNRHIGRHVPECG
jgi:hypothetical protein